MNIYFVISRIAPRHTFFIDKKADTTNYWWIKKQLDSKSVRTSVLKIINRWNHIN